MNFDLSAITFQQFFVITLTVTAIEFFIGVVTAIVPPNVFSWSVVATFLDTHILKRVLPITGLAFIAMSFGPGTNHDLVWAAAVGGLALYVGETVQSLASNWQNKSVDLTNGPVPVEEVPADVPVEEVPAEEPVPPFIQEPPPPDPADVPQ